jgi:hypothetical protein
MVKLKGYFVLLHCLLSMIPRCSLDGIVFMLIRRMRRLLLHRTTWSLLRRPRLSLVRQQRLYNPFAKTKQNINNKKEREREQENKNCCKSSTPPAFGLVSLFYFWLQNQ